jgi:hypothetical protein
MTDSRLESFVHAFDLEQHGYGAPTYFEGGEFGFSTLKESSFTLRNGAILDDGRLLTLMHVAIEPEDLESQNPKKPIYCRLQFVRERHGRFMVDELILKQVKNRPIDLISTDEYFWDATSQTFYRENAQIQAHEVLDELYDLHRKSAKNLRGLRLRSKIFLQNLSVGLLEGCARVAVYVHKLIYGEKVEYNPMLIAFREKVGTKMETEEKKKEGKKLSLFGYDADARLVVTYCILHLCAYFLMFYFDWFPMPIRKIFGNNFLTVLYVIVSLAFMEVLLKKLSRKMIETLGSWAFSVSIRNTKL